MKTTKNNKTTKESNSEAYIEPMSQAAIQQVLKNDLKAKNAVYIDEFLTVINRVLVTTKQSFCFSDFILNSKSFDLEYGLIKSYFEEWLKIMVTHKKINVLQGCDYEQKIYVLV